VLSAALIVNWFGDSLGGAVARPDGVEWPCYGFFLDRPSDGLRQFPFAISLDLTEVRLLFLQLNTAVYLKPPIPLDIAGMRLGFGDLRSIAWIAVNSGLYVMGMIGELGNSPETSRQPVKTAKKGDAGIGMSCQKWIQ